MLKILYKKEGRAYKFYPMEDIRISKDEIVRLQEEIYYDKLKEYMTNE